MWTRSSAEIMKAIVEGTEAGLDELDAGPYSMFGREHIVAAPTEPEPDYEALGYPETRVFIDDLEAVLHWERACRTICGFTMGPELVSTDAGTGLVMRIHSTDKKNQDDVDNG